MVPLRVLLVEDSPEQGQINTGLLEKFVRRRACGISVLPPVAEEKPVTWVVHQEAADQAVQLAITDRKPFGLVVLDLKYPLNGAPASTARVDQALEWLPDLRRLLPDAAIVVLTSFAEYKSAVRAVADLGAHEYISKNDDWAAIEGRIELAFKKSEAERQMRLMQGDLWELLQSRAARTLTENTSREVTSLHQVVEEVAADLESGDPSLVRSGLDRLRGRLITLKESVDRLIRTTFDENDSKPKEIDFVPWLCRIRDMYAPFFTAKGAFISVVIEEGSSPPARLKSYISDLRVALHEVVCNSLYALADSSDVAPGKRSLSLIVKTVANDLQILAEDNGHGFPPNALPSQVFEQGFSERAESNDDNRRHQGLGLYVARRMMTAIDGGIKAENITADGKVCGARVTLTIANLVR